MQATDCAKSHRNVSILKVCKRVVQASCASVVMILVFRQRHPFRLCQSFWALTFREWSVFIDEIIQVIEGAIILLDVYQDIRLVNSRLSNCLPSDPVVHRIDDVVVDAVHPVSIVPLVRRLA